MSTGAANGRLGGHKSGARRASAALQQAPRVRVVGVAASEYTAKRQCTQSVRPVFSDRRRETALATASAMLPVMGLPDELHKNIMAVVAAAMTAADSLAPSTSAAGTSAAHATSPVQSRATSPLPMRSSSGSPSLRGHRRGTELIIKPVTSYSAAGISMRAVDGREWRDFECCVVVRTGWSSVHSYIYTPELDALSPTLLTLGPHTHTRALPWSGLGSAARAAPVASAPRGAPPRAAHVPVRRRAT